MSPQQLLNMWTFGRPHTLFTILTILIRYLPFFFRKVDMSSRERRGTHSFNPTEGGLTQRKDYESTRLSCQYQVLISHPKAAISLIEISSFKPQLLLLAKLGAESSSTWIAWHDRLSMLGMSIHSGGIKSLRVIGNLDTKSIYSLGESEFLCSYMNHFNIKNVSILFTSKKTSPNWFNCVEGKPLITLRGDKSVAD